MQEISDVTPYS